MKTVKHVMIKLMSFFLIISWFYSCNSIKEKKVEKEAQPNILFFITDDESWLERSAYNWSLLPTPAFDQVAENGALFSNAYASAPSCAPSRAAVLTGRNFWELRQGAFIQAWFPKEFPLLPEILAQNGYHVGSTGKGWGPGVYPEQGYKENIIGKSYNQEKLAATNRIQGLSPLDYTENFKNFLKDNKQNQPFFFWVGSLEPHRPYAVDNYKRLEKEFGVSLKDIPMPEFLEDTPENRKDRGNMLYEICNTDRQLGRMLDLLDKENKLENTIVIVTSDNGSPFGKKSKASQYDWGVHEPLAIMWPKKIASGRQVTDFINFIDFAPTILEAANISIPTSISGKSFLDVLLSEKSGRIVNERNFTVTGLEWHGELGSESRSYRTLVNDQYSYIINYNNEQPIEIYTNPDSEITYEELYDIQNDPWQNTNLIDKIGQDSIKVKLKEQLKNYGIKTGDPRFTGDMSTFKLTRQFVEERKRNGYPK